MELTFAVIADEAEHCGYVFREIPKRRILSPENGDELAGLMERVDGKPDNIGDRRVLLTRIFTKYADWENEMLLGIIHETSFQELMDMAGRMLDNPIALMDSNLLILYRSQKAPVMETGTVWDIMKGNYLVPGNFYDPSEIRRFSEQIQRAPDHAVCYRVKRDPDHTYYAASFSVGGRVVGTLGSVSIHAPFTEGQIDILGRVRSFAMLYFERQKIHSPVSGITSGVLRQMISGQPCSRSVIQDELQRQRWQEEEEYLMLTFACPVPFYSELEMTSFINLLHFQFSKAVLTLYRRQITAVVRLADYPLRDGKYQSRLAEFLAAHEICAGGSRVYYRYEDAAAVYEQSCFAVKQAKREKMPLVFYRDAASEHIIELLGEKKNLRTFCEPVLLRLAQSGKKSDAALLECLRAYLLHGRSLSDTARALNLHRNTVVYRVQKLENILSTDLHDLSDEEVLACLLTCEILRKHPEIAAR